MSVVCPECSSEFVHFNRRKDLFVCEDCDHSFSHKADSSTIFFSYGHDKNEPLVMKIKERLEQQGYTIWIDKSMIKNGNDWRDSITDGLNSSDVVLSFLSKHSTRNPGVCLDELRIALCVKHGYIKTILLESENEVQPPSTLSGVQWFDMSDWEAHIMPNGDIDDVWLSSCCDDIVECLQSEEASDFAGEIRLLKSSLNPNLLDSKEMRLLSEGMIGRQWLVDDIASWLSREDGSRAMVLIADPGFGKSCFAANYLHYTPEAVCGIFCEWDKESSTDPKAVVRTIAFKLATKIPDYRRLLIAQLDSIGDRLASLSAEELFGELLVFPLSNSIVGGRSSSVIVLDGLDEACARDNELARMLARQIKNLPTWIRFLITSRPENDVEALFGSYDIDMLNAESSDAYDDIRQYFLETMKDLLANAENKLGVLKAMVEKSQGSFLYASLLANSITSGAMGIDEIKNFPEGLDGFYLELFERKFEDDGTFESTRNILELIAASGMIPIELLEVMVSDRYVIANFRRQLGSLISLGVMRLGESALSLDVLYFYHKSVADWLCDPMRSGRFFVDVKKGAHILGEEAARILRDTDMRQLAKEDITKANALEKCLERQIGAYFASGERWAELEAFLLDERTPLLPYWTEAARFPIDWPFDRLAQRLADDDETLDFFLSLQSSGDTFLALRLFDALESNGGVADLGMEILHIYLDLLHLSGEYKTAVERMQSFLSRYSLEEIAADHQLLKIETRMLHHGKFFTPANEILEQVTSLLDMLDPKQDIDAYLELLIACGNLGTLSGDFESAKASNQEGIELADSECRQNYYMRCLRKKVDLLKLDGDNDQALRILDKAIGGLDAHSASRYELYLLCSEADIYRLLEAYGKDDRIGKKGAFEESYQRFETVLSETTNRGIQGWMGHALLGLGALMYDSAIAHDDERLSRLEEAQSYLWRAREIYARINQGWGLICTDMYLASIDQLEGSPTACGLFDDVLDRIQELHYDSFGPYIALVESKKPIDGMPLMFI